MTPIYHNLSDNPIFSHLFNMQENAADAMTRATDACPGLEHSDPAQWKALNAKMLETYGVFTAYVNAHTHGPTLGNPDTVNEFDIEGSILNHSVFNQALSAYEAAFRAEAAASDAGMENRDEAQYNALTNALLAAHDHVIEVIEAYAAYRSARAVSRVALLHTPAPSTVAAVDTGADVEDLYHPASILNDAAFDTLFNAAQTAAWSANEADHAGLEQSDPAEWKRREDVMLTTYHALGDYINARIADARATLPFGPDALAAPDTSPMQGTRTELAAMLTWGQASNTNIVILAPNNDTKADTAFYQLKQGDAPGNYVLMRVRCDQDTPQAV